MTRHRLLLLAGLLLGPAMPVVAVRAQPAAIVLQSGETTGDRSEKAAQEDPGTGLTPAQTIRNLQFLNGSTQITAALCRGFGATIIVVLQPGEVFPTRLRARMHHPLLRRPDGATSDDDSFPVTGDDGRFYAGFTFDHWWEMQPGAWELSFYDGDRRLVSETFTVRLPGPGEPSSVCETPPVS